MKYSCFVLVQCTATPAYLIFLDVRHFVVMSIRGLITALVEEFLLRAAGHSAGQGGRLLVQLVLVHRSVLLHRADDVHQTTGSIILSTLDTGILSLQVPTLSNTSNQLT